MGLSGGPQDDLTRPQSDLLVSLPRFDVGHTDCEAWVLATEARYGFLTPIGQQSGALVEIRRVSALIRLLLSYSGSEEGRKCPLLSLETLNDTFLPADVRKY